MADLQPLLYSLGNRQQVQFRSLKAKDAESFLTFRRQVPHDTTHTLQYVGMPLPSEEELARRLEDQWKNPETLNIAAFLDQKIVGFLNFRLLHSGHPWLKHVGQFGMMVLKEHWGHGIGRKLLEIQDQHAKSIGVTKIEAMVRVTNERGINLYKRNGYKIEGLRKQAAKINGEFQDEYFIAKMLNDPDSSWKPPTLKTDRLILRPLELADAESIFSYAKNPNVCKYTLWETHRSVQDSLNFIQDYALSYYSQKTPEPFGITLKEDPQTVIGTVGCFWTSKQAKAMELAYAIAEEQWGKGLVAEASEAVMGYCFKEFSLKRIQARCKVENKASSRVMEKIDMAFEGTLKSAIFHRNKFWDMHYYAKVMDS